jgi:phosphonate ABC transporter permease subunit PhnE
MSMNTTPSPSRAALNRLLVVIAFAVGLIIFAYGWTVTDIDLRVPQEPQRQENVGNALQELLSPNVFNQEYDVQSALNTFVVVCPADFSPAIAAAAEGPVITVEPACGAAGDVVTVTGRNFAANSLSRVNWIATDGERRIREVLGTEQENFNTDADGSFSVQVEVPRIRGSNGETHQIEAQVGYAVGLPGFSETTGEVLNKMGETIFLALIATAVSILPSAILSFFAAHNLMRPVRAQLGEMLLSFGLLPVGWALGTLLLNPLGRAALNLGQGNFDLLAGAGVIVIVTAVISARKLPGGQEQSTQGKLPRGIINALLIAVGGVLVIGLIGGLGLLLGRVTLPMNNEIEGVEGFLSRIPFYIGVFIGSLGSLVELLLLPISGIIGAFTLSSIGTTVLRDPLKRVAIRQSYVIGGVLGAWDGAVLLGLTALIGLGAAWLGLLTPVVAAGIAGSLLPQLYRRLVTLPTTGPAASPPMLRLLAWIGSMVAFVVTFWVLNIRQALVEGTLPSAAPSVSLLGLNLPTYVLQAMLIGAILGGLAGLLTGTKANFPIGTVLYNITRTLLNALRSIEPLIMGLVFVIWVGIGPFAGVLALALHSVASLGKLYSEQIESIDTGPIEALQSTGANRLQTIMYAVVPQIIPPYIAFTMYRWDINVRMSTIIGFVGGGGIGFLLQQQINLLRYRDAGVAVLAIAIVVSILDYTSAAIRERYT